MIPERRDFPVNADQMYTQNIHPPVISQTLKARFGSGGFDCVERDTTVEVL